MEVIESLANDQSHFLVTDNQSLVTDDQSHSLYKLVATKSKDSGKGSGKDSNHAGKDSDGGTLTVGSSESAGHFASLFSSIGQVPRAIGAVVASGFRATKTGDSASHAHVLKSVSASTSVDSIKLNNERLPELPPASHELIAFRERMLACNSANDLAIRDLSPLLEDYKNLLYILLRS